MVFRINHIRLDIAVGCILWLLLSLQMPTVLPLSSVQFVAASAAAAAAATAASASAAATASTAAVVVNSFSSFARTVRSRTQTN